MHVQCLRDNTPLIVRGQRGPGLFTFTLDPEHFSQLMADKLGVVFDTLSFGAPPGYGIDGQFPSEFHLERTDELPMALPVVCTATPGRINIKVHSGQITRLGCEALRYAVLMQLPAWEQRATA